jgi:hypothetical protein
MPSKEWDSPMSEKSGYQPFAGETDGPGTYNNNPSIEKPTSGSFKMKFFETVPHGENLPLDSPLGTDGGKEAEKVSDLEPSKGSGDGGSTKFDSPFTKEGGLLGSKL